MNSAPEDDFIKNVSIIMAELPRLTFRLGIAYLRFRGSVGKASSHFRSGLESQDIDSETIEKLVRIYYRDSKIFSLTGGSKMFNMFAPRTQR